MNFLVICPNLYHIFSLLAVFHLHYIHNLGIVAQKKGLVNLEIADFSFILKFPNNLFSSTCVCNNLHCGGPMFYRFFPTINLMAAILVFDNLAVQLLLYFWLKI